MSTHRMGAIQIRTSCANPHAWSLGSHATVWRLAFVLAVASPPPARAEADELGRLAPCECPCATHRDECAAQSHSFVVRSFVGGPTAEGVAQHGEQLRSLLRRDVFDLDATNRWHPRCAVVLHPTRQSYLTAVGPAAAQTVGSSSVTFAAGRVTERRIDLLASDAQRGLAALPHELAHVLFADAFPITPPPKWAEEGLALLLDSPEKQARHRRDLDAAFRTRSVLPLRRFLADTDYPNAAHRATFYAQSLSIVEYLTDADSPKQFLRFLRLAVDHGPEHALQIVYGLNSEELERAWRQQILAGS